MASITEIASALDYTLLPSVPGRPDIYLNSNNLHKIFEFEVPDADKQALARWLLARMGKITSAALAEKAAAVKSAKSAQVLFSIRAIAEEAAMYPLRDGTMLGIERAYLFFCQLMCKRPLGFNIPDFEHQVSHRPLVGDLKKAFCDEFVTRIHALLSDISPAPAGRVWSAAIKAKPGQFEVGRREGAAHATLNATVPLEDQDHYMVIQLVKDAPAKPKGKASAAPQSKPAKSAAAPKGAQQAAGGGGGGPSPASKKRGSAA